MKMKALFLSLLWAVLSTAALAQNGYVTVTATIPTYAGGQATSSFQNQSSLPQLPLLNGSVFATTGVSNLDVNGTFTITLADNTIVQPNPSQWQIIVCAKSGNVGQPCYPVTLTITCVNNSACVNGVLNISAAFANAPSPGVPIVAPTIQGGDTVLPIWIDPRAFGAKCNGTNDDTAALNAAAAATGLLSTPLFPWGLYIPNLGQACTTTSGIVMPVTTSRPVYVNVAGSLRATASQTSLISIGTNSAFVAGGEISGGGTLDANGLAQNAVWVHNLNDFAVHDVIINNATVAGVHWGDPATSQASFGGSAQDVLFIVYDLTATPPAIVAKTTGSIAEFMDNSTDNHSKHNEERGYDIGVSAEGGTDYISEDHCWGHSGQVPSTCFLDRGNGDFWDKDYADGPSLYGFHMMFARDTITAPKVLCAAPFCPTNTVIGIQFDNAAPGSTVENGFFAGTSSSTLLADIGGSAAALATLRLGGNISGGHITTVHTANYEQIPYGAAVDTTAFAHFSGGTFPSFVADSQSGFPLITGSVVTFPSSGSNSAGSFWSTDSNGNTTFINVPNTGATPATLDLSTWTLPQPPGTWEYHQITGFGQHVFNATNTSQACTYDLRLNGTNVLCYNQAGQWISPSPIFAPNLEITNSTFAGSMQATLTGNRTYTLPDATGAVPVAPASITTGRATCWKATGQIGYCSTQPDTTGACTCN